MNEKIEKLRKFIVENSLKDTQMFNTSSIFDDEMLLIYENDGVDVMYSPEYGYLEITGLSREEYNSLNDILNIY